MFVIDLPTGRQTKSSALISIGNAGIEFFLHATRQEQGFSPYKDYLKDYPDPDRPVCKMTNGDAFAKNESLK